MNYLLVATSILSYTIQNTVDVICITNTRHKHEKNNVKKKFTFTVIMIHAAAKSLHSCLTLCDPIDGSPPGSAPPSLGFSRHEHWSGLPFLSPMHESEK